MAAALDTQGALYLLEDSALAVRVVNAPHLLSGSVTVTPDKSINGAVNKSYGFAVAPY